MNHFRGIPCSDSFEPGRISRPLCAETTGSISSNKALEANSNRGRPRRWQPKKAAKKRQKKTGTVEEDGHHDTALRRVPKRRPQRSARYQFNAAARDRKSTRL